MWVRLWRRNGWQVRAALNGRIVWYGGENATYADMIAECYRRGWIVVDDYRYSVGEDGKGGVCTVTGYRTLRAAMAAARRAEHATVIDNWTGAVVAS